MRRRFHGLDGLRGVCALTVVLYHSELLFRPGVIFCHGYLAVDIFFILSGFVIAARYEALFAHGLGAWQFLQLRIKRLGPVYWVGSALALGAAFVAACFRQTPDFARTLVWGVMGFFLVPQTSANHFAYPVNSVAWSLLWEIIVNVLYAAWLFRLRSRSLLLIAGAGWALALAESLVNPRGWSFGMTGSDVELAGLRAIPAYLAGVLLYRAQIAKLLDRLPAVSPLLPVAAWLALSVVPEGVPPMFDACAVIFAGMLLVALLVRNSDASPAWFGPAGGISYALYASHLALITLARETPFFGLNRHPAPLNALVLVLLALALAWAIHARVERGPSPKAPLGALAKN